MRTRPFLLLGLLAMAVLHPSAQAGPAVTTSNTVQHGACGFSYDQPSGDASVVDLGQSQPYAKSQDVTHVSLQLTKSAIVVVATVPGLTEQPVYNGDAWEMLLSNSDSTDRRDLTFGYFRSKTQGGGPYLYGTAHPHQTDLATNNDAPTVPTRLAVLFDVPRHTVTLSLPRADAERVVGRSLKGLVFRGFEFISKTRFSAYDNNYSDNGGSPAANARINVPLCDAALSQQRRPAVPRCFIPGLAGDELSPVPGASLRPDDADLVGLKVDSGPAKVSVTLALARLTSQTAVGASTSYTFSVGGRSVTVRRTGAALLVTGVSNATATSDLLHGLIRLTLPRAGMPATSTLTVVSSVDLGTGSDTRTDSAEAKGVRLSSC